MRFAEARTHDATSGGHAEEHADACAVVRRAVEAFDREDWATLRDLLHPQVRFHPLRAIGRFVVGRSRALESMCTLRQTEMTITLASLDVLEDGRILALGSVQRGPDSHPFAAIHEVRNGKIVEARHYFSDAELLQELGIVRRAATGVSSEEGR
ncbi:MAG TPA: nuclear transport factor 2 family protein [Capillimicrobium sp.]|nr:nuclear transport factor 2 family protein [Capillimicrobium sp.]